jgi:peptidoglycan/LPS O-acetylase OafA/YrhL
MTASTLEVSGNQLRTKAHVPALDAYRGLAATAVVATHVAFQTGRVTQGPFAALLARLDFGVALFFILSGFLLFRPFVVAVAEGGRAPRTSGYLWRRALRILPAYWVVVAVGLAFLPANQDSTLGTWLRQLLLLQVYRVGDLVTGLTQMWSLAIEVAFYLALPVLALLLLRAFGRRRWFGSLVLGVSVMVAVNVTWLAVIHAGGASPGARGFWLPAFLSWFAAGMLLAGVSVRLAQPGRLPSWGRPLLEAAAAPFSTVALGLAIFLLATTAVAGPRAFESEASSLQAVAKNLLYAASAMCLVLPAALAPAAGNAFLQTFERPLFRRLGDVSYGIFLWHLIVLDCLFRWTHQTLFTGRFAVMFVATWSVTLLVSLLSWFLLERPLRRFRRLVPR